MNFEEGDARITVTQIESGDYRIVAEIQYLEDDYERTVTGWAPDKALALMCAHEMAIDLDAIELADKIEHAYRMHIAQSRMQTLSDWLSDHGT